MGHVFVECYNLLNRNTFNSEDEMRNSLYMLDVSIVADSTLVASSISKAE